MTQNGINLRLKGQSIVFKSSILNKRTIYTYLKNICIFNPYKPKNIQLDSFFSRYDKDVIEAQLHLLRFKP